MNYRFHYFSGAIFYVMLVQCRSARAQQPEWPPIPKLDIRDNLSPLEREYAIRCKPYFDLSSQSYDYLPLSQLWQTPGLNDEALQEFEMPKKFRGLLALAPQQANLSGIGYCCLSLKQLGNENLPKHPQIFYRKLVNHPVLNSPLISPNGKAIVLLNGLPRDGVNLVLWDLVKGKFRFIPDTAFRNENPQLFESQAEIRPWNFAWSPGSRFVAYIRGGDLGRGENPPCQLCVLDTITRQERVVLSDCGDSWSWTYNGKLLCSRQTTDWTTPKPRPSVYIADPNCFPRAQKLFDGGCYAQASPDGKWIAFYDWPGDLLEGKDAPLELVSNTKKGLFLFDMKTRRRIFIGAVQPENFPDAAPLIQWSTDSQNLFVLKKDRTEVQGEIVGRILQMNLGEKQLRPLTTISFRSARGGACYLSRGISPNGKQLYYEFVEPIDGPKNLPSTQSTLIAVNTRSGKMKKMLTLKNVGYENPGWDFLDQSGVNPAQRLAQKVEKALPAWKERI